MPENGGIDRTIILPDVPRIGRSIFALFDTANQDPAMREIKEGLQDLLKYLEEQKLALSMAYDELAKRMNELPEMVWLPFGATIAANVTNQALGNGLDLNGFSACEEGSVVAVSVNIQNARTAGTLTIEPTIAGTGTGFTITLDGTNTTSNADSQEQGSDIFAQKDLVGCRYTTTADWTPVGTEIDVSVGVVIARGGK